MCIVQDLYQQVWCGLGLSIQSEYCFRSPKARSREANVFSLTPSSSAAPPGPATLP
jgi:hypothetical protein